MFRTKLTLVGIVLAAAILGLVPHRALAAHDSWYGYAVSLTKAQQSHDPWYGYAVSRTQARQPVPFITDTLAPGGKAAVQGYRFITDTLAPGGGAPVQSYRFITDTLAPGGGTSEVVSPAPSGFDWADAGVGAGVMAGIALLLLASGRLLQQRRKLVAV